MHPSQKLVDLAVLIDQETVNLRIAKALVRKIFDVRHKFPTPITKHMI